MATGFNNEMKWDDRLHMATEKLGAERSRVPVLFLQDMEGSSSRFHWTKWHVLIWVLISSMTEGASSTLVESTGQHGLFFERSTLASIVFWRELSIAFLSTVNWFLCPALVYIINMTKFSDLDISFGESDRGGSIVRLFPGGDHVPTLGTMETVFKADSVIFQSYAPWTNCLNMRSAHVCGDLAWTWHRWWQI